MSNLTYDQRVQQMAEKFAQELYGSGYDWSKTITDSYLHNAKIAVAAQAEAIREALRRAGNGWWCQPGRIEDYLIENGYVPAPEATETPNVEQPSTSMGISPDKQIWMPISHEQWYAYPIGTKIKGATGAVQEKTRDGWVCGGSDLRNKPFKDEPYLIKMPLTECEHVNSSWDSVSMARVCDDCGYKLPEDPSGQYAMGAGH